MEIKEDLLDIEGIKSSKRALIDLFIRRTAVLTSTPEWMVEKIIKDQWRAANKRTQPDSHVSEFDFPNLGTFYISSTKASKRLARVIKFHDEMEALEVNPDEKLEKKRTDKLVKLKETIQSIKYKTKLQDV